MTIVDIYSNNDDIQKFSLDDLEANVSNRELQGK